MSTFVRTANGKVVFTDDDGKIFALDPNNNVIPLSNNDNLILISDKTSPAAFKDGFKVNWNNVTIPVVTSRNDLIQQLATDFFFTPVAQSTVTEDHIFESIAARDAYFTARLEELITGTPIIVQTGTPSNPTSIVQVWSGTTNPNTYDNTLWVDAGSLNLTAEQIALIVALENVTAGTIPVKSGLTYANSSLRETADSIISSKTFISPPGSIGIGLNAILSNALRALNITDPILNRRGLLLAQIITDTGSELPFAYEMAAITTTTINSGTGEAADTAQFVYTPTANNYLRRIRITTNQVSANVDFEVFARLQSHTGTVVFNLSQTITTNASGVGQIIVGNPLLVDANTDLYIEVNCQGMQGSQVSGSFIPTSEVDVQVVTRRQIVTVDKLVAGTGVSLDKDPDTGVITINATGSFSAPRLTNFGINIASRVDLNTNLNTQHTITFDVLNNANIQSLVLDVTGGDNITLTNPTSDGTQTQQVTLSNIDTSQNATLRFKITGTDTQGDAFESNEQVVNVRDAAASEFIYYGIGQSLDPTSVDLSTLQKTEVTAAGSFDITLPESGTSAANDDIIILAPVDRDLTQIINKALNTNVIASFTKVDNDRVINSVNYNSYELDNLNAGLTFNYTLHHN